MPGDAATLISETYRDGAPDLSTSTTLYANGRLQSNTRRDNTSLQIASTTLAYDPHGRPTASTDARNGATTTTFYQDDTPASITTPDGHLQLPTLESPRHRRPDPAGKRQQAACAKVEASRPHSKFSAIPVELQAARCINELETTWKQLGNEIDFEMVAIQRIKMFNR